MGENSWNWIFGQKFDFSNSVPNCQGRGKSRQKSNKRWSNQRNNVEVTKGTQVIKRLKKIPLAVKSNICECLMKVKKQNSSTLKPVSHMTCNWHLGFCKPLKCWIINHKTKWFWFVTKPGRRSGIHRIHIFRFTVTKLRYNLCIVIVLENNPSGFLIFTSF